MIDYKEKMQELISMIKKEPIYSNGGDINPMAIVEFEENPVIVRINGELTEKCRYRKNKEKYIRATQNTQQDVIDIIKGK